MEIIDLSKSRAHALKNSADTLLAGGVVIFPTDTVYGIGALPKFPSAINKIFELKKRPTTMPLPLLLSDENQINEISSHDSPAMTKLVDAFWPGPSTLILPDVLSDFCHSADEEETIAVRCPNHDFIRELISRTGPLATTSANLHGKPTPVALQEIAELFQEVEVGIDGGECDHGAASTIVDLSKANPEVIREGPISETQILQLLNGLEQT